MTRNLKLLLGAAAVWPLVGLIVLIAFVKIAVALGFDPDAADRDDLSPGQFVVVFSTGLVMMSLIFAAVGAIVYDLVHIANADWTASLKVAWIAALLFGCGLTLPVFWYLHVRTAPEPNRRVRPDWPPSTSPLP